MSSKMKEDEKNEKLIRVLLKLSGNRNCINCNLQGPQYVCTTFSTFVCTTCCSIHREFTHRVKSVSMAKFTPEEMTSLQAGGNERAKEVFFKGWDPQRQKSPDSSNVDKLRKFIKHVYVDRRYTGKRSADKPPRVKKVDKEEPNENGKTEPKQRDSDVKRRPGYDQDNQRQSHYGKSAVTTARVEIVSNWRREDRFSKGKKADDSSSSEGELKPEIKPRDSQNDSSISSPPTVLPIGDLLGEDIKPLEISERATANSTTVTEDTELKQRTTSSSSVESSHGNPTESKLELSLIDFDSSPDPAETSTVTQVQQSTATPIDDSWGCLVIVPENNASQALPVTNQLDFMFTDLSVPALAPVSSLASGGVAQHSSLSIQGLTGNVVAQAPETSLALTQVPQVAVAKKNQELPMDLFTATYSAIPHQGPAWQTSPHPGTGFPTQYNTAMSTPTISQQFKTPNPFDANAGISPSQAAAFPSMSSLHSALPNMAVQGGPSWMPPHTSSYPEAVPSHGASFRPDMAGAYMGQVHSNMPPQFGPLNPAAGPPNSSLGSNPFG